MPEDVERSPFKKFKNNEKSTSVEISVQSADTCRFFLKKKQRYCRTRPDYDGKFCVAHACKVNTDPGSTTMESTKSQEESPKDTNCSPKESNFTLDRQPKSKDIQHKDEANKGNPPIPDPSPGRCQFYLERKNRHCRTRPDFDGRYCVQHAYDTNCVPEQENQRIRIPCPLDPNHSIYKNRLQHHLNICNKTKWKNSIPGYYVESINVPKESIDKQESKVSIRDCLDSEVLELAQKVSKLHSENVGVYETEILSHDALQEEINNPQNGVAAQKHLQQQASIIGHMEKEKLLNDNCSYVEFGAGKGGLSHWVQLALKEAKNNQYILIDKSSVRYKMDNFHRGEDQGPTFQRIKIDIQGLVLKKIETIENDPRSVIGLGKHLCGGATDLMLRCLKAYWDNCQSVPCSKGQPSGVAVALCCHHRCDWNSYVGKEFFLSLGLGPRDFSLISSMTSWATCGTRPSTQEHESSHHDHEEDQEESFGKTPNNAYHHHRYGSLDPVEREHIGIQCKQLIDKGRQEYLTFIGFKCRTICFVDKKHTLENMMLVATRR